MQELEATFAGYQLHDALSQDAVSTVYRATTRSFDATRPGGPRTVALLISEPLISETDRRQARVFQRKATAAMDVNHPGVALVLDVGTSDDRVYMATAWRESVTLEQMLSSRWQLPPDDAIALLELLAEGLDIAHDAGLLHGALSTKTIRVRTGEMGGSRDAFVTGFGIDALLAQRLGSKRQRDSSPVLDDLLYVAPEQLRGDMLDPATDQYALACALYHCVSGQPPFVRDTASALFGAHLFARPRVADVLAADSNHALRSALATGLAKRPEDRHGSCIRLLRAALGEQDGDYAAPAVTLSTAAAPSGAVGNGVGEWMAAGMAATGTTLSRAGSGLAARARTGRGSLGSGLRHVPTPAITVAALVAGAVLALIIIGLLRSDPGSPTSQGDDAAAANAVVDEPQPGTAPEPESPPEPEPSPSAVIDWNQTVADAAVSSVTASGDEVIVATENRVVALDGDSGAPRWRRVVDDGTVERSIVTDDSVVYRSSQLHSVALADGEPRWSRNDQYTPTGSLTAVSGGLLYGMGPGLNMPELTAMDPEAGEELWHFHHSADDVHVMPNAGVAADDNLVAILQRGSLFAIDPNGELITTSLNRREIANAKWRVDVARPWVSSVTLLPDAVLLATRTGAVCSHALRDGASQWCRRVDGVADRQPTLLPGSDLIIVATPAGVVTLDPSTGVQQWDVPAQARISAAARRGDTVVTGDAEGTIRAFAVASGQQLWQTTGPTGITALSITADGVYAGALDGTVARVRPPPG